MPPAWYNLFIALLTPLYRLRVWWRSRTYPDYAAEIQQRFGPMPSGSAGKPHIWVHAVSVGESHAAAPFIQHYLDQQYAVVVTNTTRTGQARIRALFGNTVTSVFLPVDSARLMAQFIAYYRPALALLIETELWPNMLALLQQAGVVSVLVNARLSARSARGYARVARLSRPMVTQLSAILAQDAATASRFRALGAEPQQVHITGSVKFDLNPPKTQLATAQDISDMWPLAKRKVMVLASTHADEEKSLLADFKRLHSKYPSSLLIVVPRHPERFDDVAESILECGFELYRRSHNDLLPQGAAVYLADSMGELWTWFALAHMAFIGGSLVPVGGHNVLEPARLGVPVVVGPHTFNFAHMVLDMLDNHALVQVDDAAAVMATFERWLVDDTLRQAMGRAALTYVESQRGGLQRQLAILESVRCA